MTDVVTCVVGRAVELVMDEKWASGGFVQKNQLKLIRRLVVGVVRSRGDGGGRVQGTVGGVFGGWRRPPPVVQAGLDVMCEWGRGTFQ